jgi:hypothetical protein
VAPERTRAPERAGGTARDLTVTAVILGAAGALWFGWGQAQPPAGWGLPMSIGSFAAIAAEIAAGVAVRRFRPGATAMESRRARQAYGITIGIETAVIGLGAAGLALAGRSASTAPWILLVVGVHFLPLGRLFGSVDLLRAGLMLSAIAVAAAVTGAVSAVALSTGTGPFGGLVLVAAAAASLERALRRAQPDPAPQDPRGT